VVGRYGAVRQQHSAAPGVYRLLPDLEGAAAACAKEPQVDVEIRQT
jgi:hypothetical protein